MLGRLLLACLLLAVGASSWLSGDPAFGAVRRRILLLMVSRHNHPLADCQLRIWLPGYTNNTLDFERGTESDVQEVALPREVRATARYAGAGLASGDCGVYLAGVAEGHYLVQFAGKLAANGSWVTGFALMRTKPFLFLESSSATPSFILATTGSDVSVQLDVERGKMSSCNIDTPAAGRVHVLLDESLPPSSRYRIHDAGMRWGQCNLTLTNVQQADAGLWTWYGWRDGRIASKVTAVAVVAAPRGGPELRVRDAGTLSAGDFVEATCSAPAAVPPSALTWLLDGVIVRNDTAYDTEDGKLATWTLPWEPKPARQTLRHLLTSADLGKTLECRAQHVAEVGARADSVVLGVAKN